MLATTPWLERKDDTIHLTGAKMSREAIEQYVNPMIQERLQTLVPLGWEADGSVDVRTLWREGRLSCREHAGFWSEKHTYDVSSVTIRVRRISTA